MKYFKDKKANRLNIGLAILWIILFISNLLFVRTILALISTGFIAFSYVLMIYINRKIALVELTDNLIISRINITKKELHWKDVTSKKYFAGEWKLIGKEKTITISKDFFSAEDWTKINEFIEQKNID
jgi:hypothetical protein